MACYTTEPNGQRYAYLDEGEGPLVVFGHGVLADKSMFEAQIEALRDRYRCVSLDWPGHTGSGYREKGWSFYDMADDSVALASELKAAGADLVDCSTGGVVPRAVTRSVTTGTRRSSTSTSGRSRCHMRSSAGLRTG